MMVAKGNPKAIATIDGLVRSNVRSSMPKPVNEGSCNFMRARWSSATKSGRRSPTAGECASCQTTERNWFTAVHHREIPERSRGKSDAGTARARTIVLRFLRLKSRGMPARLRLCKKPGGSSWPSSRSTEGGGATMSQSGANGCRFANYRAPAIGSCRPRASCSIPPRRRRSAPITLDSRWPRQCDVRCD
jgi:hypothetical protein